MNKQQMIINIKNNKGFADMYNAMREYSPMANVLWLMWTLCPDITSESLYAEMLRIYTEKPFQSAS